MKKQEDGFTLVELLVVILIIGILAAFAIPAFLNQRKAAHDASLESDVRNIAIQAQTLPYDAKRLAKGNSSTAQSITYFSNDKLRTQSIKTSDGSWWTITGDSTAYCIVGYHTGGNKYTLTTPLVYDSTAGGLGKKGDACDPADVLDENGQVIATGNLVPDPLFKNLEITNFAPGNFGANGYVESYHSAPLKTINANTPVGTKAIQIQTPDTTKAQGIIFNQSGKSDAIPVQKAGEKWALSMYIKAPAGSKINFGWRAIDVNKGYNREGTTPKIASGEWERYSYIYTTTVSDIGSYLGTQMKGDVQNNGVVMEVAGPMVEKSGTINPFRADK